MNGVERIDYDGEVAFRNAVREAKRNGDAEVLQLFSRSSLDASDLAVCARVFGTLRLEEESDHLRAWSQDPDPVLRRAALIALAMLRNPRNIDIFRSTVTSDDDHAARIWAMQGVGILEPSERTRAALAEALRHPEAELSRGAARRLSRDRSSESAELLTRALGDERPTVRWVARQALVRQRADGFDALIGAASIRARVVWWLAARTPMPIGDASVTPTRRS